MFKTVYQTDGDTQALQLLLYQNVEQKYLPEEQYLEVCNDQNKDLVCVCAGMTTGCHVSCTL